MDVDFGSFKFLLKLNSIIGTNVTSLDTLERHAGKVLFGVSIAGVYVAEYCIYIYNQWTNDIAQGKVAEAARLFNVSFMVISIGRAIQDHKTKISSALTLEAIKKELKSVNLFRGEIDESKMLQALSWLSIGLYSSARAVNTLLHRPPTMPITMYFTAIHYTSFYIVQCSTIAVFFLNIKRIQEDIVRGMAEKDTTVSPPLLQTWAHRRGSSLETGLSIQLIHMGRFKILKALQNALYNTEMSLKRSFWVTVVWWVVTIVLVPSYFATEEKYPIGQILFLLGPMVLLFLLLILDTTQLQLLRQQTGSQMLSFLYNRRGRSENLRREVRHQVLANIHRSSPFSCRLFDVDFALVGLVLEVVLLVVVTIYGG